MHERIDPTALAAADGGDVVVRAYPGGPVIGHGVVRVDEHGLFVDATITDVDARRRLEALVMPAPFELEPIPPLEHFLRYGDVDAVRRARAIATMRISTRRLAAAVLAPFERLLDAIARRIP